MLRAETHSLKKIERERGQGISSYSKNGFPASRKGSYECGCHEVLILEVCYKYVYQNLVANDAVFNCLLNSIASAKENDWKVAFLFVGDFNTHHKE